MTAQAVVTNNSEKKDKRAKSIAAMGLVNREGDKFVVATPSLRGRQTSYEVRRDEQNRVRCNCLEFEEAVVSDSGFRCEHILAVKYAVLTKNSEPVTKQPVKINTEVTVVSKDKSATESSDLGFGNADLGFKKDKSEIRKPKAEIEMSKDGEQKTDEVTADASGNGQTEAVEAEQHQLANTKGKNIMMKQENLQTMPVNTAHETQNVSNVIQAEFPQKLQQLRKDVDPNLIRQREGWRDRNGNVQMVDYVEWHTVADILDETAPNWTHSVKDMRQIGDIFTVTVAITIDNVTREGVGTGLAGSEMGIKKAEHDALKRAAVKFGIARELYKKESDTIEREGAIPANVEDNIPANPVARSLSDLVTAKQLGMIRALAREMNIDADEESNSLMQCRTDELSKRAASSLIQHLQDMQNNQQVPMRRAS